MSAYLKVFKLLFKLLHAVSFDQQVESHDLMMILKMTTHHGELPQGCMPGCFVLCNACAGHAGIVGTLTAR